MTSLNIFGQDPEDRGDRRDQDFYPTEPQATHAFAVADRASILTHAGHSFLSIWEPACGDGAMSRVFEDQGYSVHSTDLVDRGYGASGIDFLKTTHSDVGRMDIGAIITNPPFGDLAAQFIEHAHYLEVPYIALLLKSHYFHTQNRLELRRRFPLARVYPIGWRLDFTGQGAPHMDCSWFIWDTLHPGAHTWYMPTLERPADINTRDLFPA